MNTSGSSNNFITRRDFMKKSALTVGAITLLSQGIGLAAGSGGSSSGSSDLWDMKCVAPPQSLTVPTQAVQTTLPLPFYAIFDLIITSNKAADDPSADCYNTTNVQHEFTFGITANGVTDPINGTSAPYGVHGKNVFTADCDEDFGIITSSFDAAASSPSSGTTIRKTFMVDSLYSVEMTIYIVRSQGGPDVTTKIFGSVYWNEIFNPSNNGHFQLPKTPGACIEMTNTYESHNHH